MKKKMLDQFTKRGLLPVAVASLLWAAGAGASDLGIEQGFPDIQVARVELSYDYETEILQLVEGFPSNYIADLASIPGADMAPTTAIQMQVGVPSGQSDVGGLATFDSLGNANGADLIITGFFEDDDGNDIGDDLDSVLLELDLTTIAFGGATDVEDEVQLLGTILGGIMVDEGLMGDIGSEVGLIFAAVGYAEDEDTLEFVAEGGWERLGEAVADGEAEPDEVPVFVEGSEGTLDITTQSDNGVPIPVPAPIALMGLGLLGMAGIRKTK